MATLKLEAEPKVSTLSPAVSHHFWGVVLAGGDGTRLRDLTRRIAGDCRPKQFCRIVGDESLLYQTRTRLRPLVLPDREVVVVSRAHEAYYREDLAATNDSCIIEQPLNRGTGIAIVLATVHILLRDPDAVVGFFPCDHYYSDDDSFRSTIRSAAACVQRHPESIILIGAKA